MSDPVLGFMQHLPSCAWNQSGGKESCSCGYDDAEAYYHSILARLEKAEAELAVDARYIDQIKAERDQLRKDLKLELNLGIEVVHDAVAPHLVTISKLEAELATLRAECKRKDEALAWYAEKCVMLLHAVPDVCIAVANELTVDAGQRARDALTAPRGTTEERR